MFSRFAKVALDAAPCISRLKPAKFGRRVSAVRCGSEARPKEDSHGSLFESDREFPSELEDVRIAHDVLSKSNTTGIPDDAT